MKGHLIQLTIFVAASLIVWFIIDGVLRQRAKKMSIAANGGTGAGADGGANADPFAASGDPQK